MKALPLAALALAACHSHTELTASEAIQAADAELVMGLPQMKHHRLDVRAELRDHTWHIEYGGGCGGATVTVDSRTGAASVVNVQQ